MKSDTIILTVATTIAILWFLNRNRTASAPLTGGGPRPPAPGSFDDFSIQLSPIIRSA